MIDKSAVVGIENDANIDISKVEKVLIKKSPYHSVSSYRLGKYFLLFEDECEMLKSLGSPLSYRLMFKLAGYMCNGSNRVDLSTRGRTEIIKSLGVSRQYYYQLIRSLRECHILLEDDGYIFMNPRLFWKGSLRGRDEMIRSFDLLSYGEQDAVSSEFDSVSSSFGD